MKPILDDIKILVESLAEKIKAPKNLLPTYGSTIDGAHPHIEMDGNGRFFYVIVERGEELRRDLAIDIDDLLYKIFAGVTFSMACEFAAKHPKKNEDFRRRMFEQQEELLGVLKQEWKTREQKEHQAILQSHPFVDK